MSWQNAHSPTRNHAARRKGHSVQKGRGGQSGEWLQQQQQRLKRSARAVGGTNKPRDTLRPGLFKCAMKAADLAARRPPRPPRPRFILALFRTIFTLAALAICQSTSPSSLSPSQTRTSACSHRINAFDYHVPFLNETALAATLSLYQSIDRPPTGEIMSY